MTGEPQVWRGFTRSSLDAAYNNGAAVANSQAKIAEWNARSAALRERMPDELDIAYGPRERNRIDVFRCGMLDAPMLAFIHGGYWMRNSRQTFSCLAAGPLARGFDVAMIGYTLAPDIRLRGIVAEVRAAIAFLRSAGLARGRLIVSGWSAGGHLAASCMDMTAIDSGLSISGVFDVEPCRLNYLNDTLHLDAEEARETSPILNIPAKAGPFIAVYGENELPELCRQSVDYIAAWKAAGLRGNARALASHDHFSILEELASPDGELAARLPVFLK